mgnify:CR=1 FL=1
MKAVSPNQGDLFGARDLWRCSLPLTGLATEDDEIGRLKRKIHELTVELAESARLKDEQARDASYYPQRAEDEKRKAQQYAREAVDAGRKYADLLGETQRLQREISRMVGAKTCAIPKATWRLLMQLVHPDKHNVSPASQAAAKWLNENKPD